MFKFKLRFSVDGKTDSITKWAVSREACIEEFFAAYTKAKLLTCEMIS